MTEYGNDVRKIAGFTLIELVVVLALIGIMAVLVVPRWTTAPTLDAQTQQALSNLRYAQQLAMTHNQRFRVNFTSTTYDISDLAGTAITNPTTGSTSITLTGGVTLTWTNLPNNLVAFDENGTPYTDSAATTPLATNATIVLHSGSITRTITITQQTGSMAAS